jgi:hypothetical protein
MRGNIAQLSHYQLLTKNYQPWSFLRPMYIWCTLILIIFLFTQLDALRELHNEELHDLYSSPCTIIMIKSRTIRWPGYVARIGRPGRHIGVLLGKPEGKRPPERHRCRWEDNPSGHSPYVTSSLTRGWATLTNCPAYNISTRTAQKISFFCCCLRVVF